MDSVGLQDVNNAKLVHALHTVNHQLAESNSKLKRELCLSEKRWNTINDMLLCTRQENKSLRDMVRKLKDQLGMVAQVIVSVHSQSEQLFDFINQPHAIAEENERNREPRAQQMYERMREEKRYWSSFAILEEDEQDEFDSPGEGNNTSSDMDVSPTSPAMCNHSTSGCDQLVASSPLVQRLKRPSKNASLDESFETIDRERAFKLSRVSRERRHHYAGLMDDPDILREVGSSPKQMDRSNTVPSQERCQQPDKSSDMELEDTLRASLDNIASVRVEDYNSSSSESTQTEPTLRYDQSNNTNRCGLKKMASESMLSTIDHATAVSHSFEDFTVLGPEDTIANASCSTPVTKDTRLAKSSLNRNRSLAAAQKMMKSDTSVNRSKQPMVVVRPLTEENVRSLATRTRTRKNSLHEITSHNGPGSSVWSGRNMEPSSSTENLSVISNESSRPRRKAAPKTLRENSLRTKMRRE